MDFRNLLSGIDRRRLRLLELLYEQRTGCSTEYLLASLDCSLPVLLKDQKNLNEAQSDFHIEKRQGLYYLRNGDRVSLSELYSFFLKQSTEFCILEELLYERYENISQLAQALFISPSHTQRCLRKLDRILRQAKLMLRHRPLRIIGPEGVVRQLYYRYFTEKFHEIEVTLPQSSSYQKQTFERFANSFIETNGYQPAYIFKHRLVYNLYISAWRIKNGHFFPERQLNSAYPQAPEPAVCEELQRVLKSDFGLVWQETVFRELMWLQFSDALIFNDRHREQALKENKRVRRQFEIHSETVAQLNELFSVPVSQQVQQELVTTMMNSSFLHPENGSYIQILRRNERDLVQAFTAVYGQSIAQILDLLRRQATRYELYQEEGFRYIFAYWMLTLIPDSMERLQKAGPAIRVLVVSSLTPTEEKFIAHLITTGVCGNFTVDTISAVAESVYEISSRYDLIISTGQLRRLSRQVEFMAVDPVLDGQSMLRIQKKISELALKKSAIPELSIVQ